MHARRVGGRSILVIDDLFTTGTTLSECARVLSRELGTLAFFKQSQVNIFIVVMYLGLSIILHVCKEYGL
jgi:hypoxanthine phosphoribosyltransferase